MTRRIRWTALTAVAGLSAISVFSAGAQTTTPTFDPGAAGVSGSAYGARASLTATGLPRALLGRVAQQGLPCFAERDLTATNQVATARLGGNLALPELLDTGTVVNQGTVDVDDLYTDVVETSTVEDVSLLDGMIRATLVKSRAHARLDQEHLRRPNFFTAEGDELPSGATFVDLVVAGQKISATPPPNTTITLPGGIGKVILNEIVYEDSNTTDASRSTDTVRVIAIHVKLTNLATYKGEIIVALARAGASPQPARLQASAFELTAKVGSLVEVGRQNLLTLPCPGGHKTESSVGIAATPLPITSDTLKSTVDGDAIPGASNTRAIAEIEQLDIAGIVTADLIVGRANAFQDAGGVHADANGSQFIDLVVAGEAINVAPPPNTTIPIANLGRVILNRQLCYTSQGDPRGYPYRPTADNPCGAEHGARLVVTAIVMEVLYPNDSGLPVGTQIRVSEASAGVRI